jgi:hypothetical protein
MSFEEQAGVAVALVSISYARVSLARLLPLSHKASAGTSRAGYSLRYSSPALKGTGFSSEGE